MNIKLVDGAFIRNIVDVDFSGEGSNVMYSYIPSGVMWLDEVLSDEKAFFVKLHSLERELLQVGLSYENSRKIVCETLVSKSKQKPNPVLGTYNWFPKDKDLKILIVDGQMVREFFDPKFIQGGHDLVYSYIPKNTIWMENAFKKEYLFTLLHEIYERKKMSTGMAYHYAHNAALVIERAERIKVLREKLD